MEKHVLVKEMFPNWLNMDLPLQIEQRSVIKYLLAEKYKLCEIYRRMCDVYGEAYFSSKIVNKCVIDNKCFFFIKYFFISLM